MSIFSPASGPFGAQLDPQKGLARGPKTAPPGGGGVTLELVAQWGRGLGWENLGSLEKAKKKFRRLRRSGIV